MVSQPGKSARLQAFGLECSRGFGSYQEANQRMGGDGILGLSAGGCSKVEIVLELSR